VGIAHSATMASHLARGLTAQADASDPGGASPPKVTAPAPLTMAAKRRLDEAQARAEFEDALLVILAPHKRAYAEITSWLFPATAARNSQWRSRNYEVLARIAALEHALEACDHECEAPPEAPDASPAPEAPP